MQFFFSWLSGLQDCRSPVPGSERTESQPLGWEVIIWDNPHVMCLHGCVLGHFTCVQLFVTLWTTAHQAPLSMGFSRQEYGSGLACPPSGDLPDPGIESESPALQADSLPTESSGKPHIMH